MDYALQMLHEQRDSVSKERAAQIVAAVKQLHVDEMSPGTKVSFVKRFSGDNVYTYLALKVERKSGEQLWYITGDDDYRSNERFEELLASRLGFEHFQVLVPAQPVPNADVMAGWAGARGRSLKQDDEITNPLPTALDSFEPRRPTRRAVSPMDDEESL